MDSNQLLDLQNGSVDTSQLPDTGSLLNGLLGPVFWISIALTVLMIALYVFSMMRKRKLERAILDMQKILNEMNERDKARSNPMLKQNQFEQQDKIIAKSNDSSNTHTTG